MSPMLDKSKLEDISKKLPAFSNNRTKIGAILFDQLCGEIISTYSGVFPIECGQFKLVKEMWAKGLCDKICDKNLCVVLASNLVSKMLDYFDEKYKSPKVFISHSTNDVAIVEKLVTMLEQIGVKQSQLFCSSIAGYGIPQGAGDLYDYIRNEMSNDNLFVIMMLSPNYYSSPVCLNEMGAAWVKQSSYQSILLPGFRYSEIKGAVNPRDMSFSLADRENRNLALNEFKDRIIAHLGLADIGHSLWERFRDKFTEEVDKLTQLPSEEKPATTEKKELQVELSTDDERVVLWYILSKKVRKVKKADVLSWLQADEIYDINVDNAFDLLSTLGNCKVTEDALEFDVDLFRKLIEDGCADAFQDCIISHRQLGSEGILRLWETDKLDDAGKLFLAYIVEERVTTFGNRWLAEHQIAHIKEWESKNLLDDTLSANYASCLNLFIHSKFVFENEWTRDGNPRQYKLCQSLEKMLLVDGFVHSAELETIKAKHMYELPF